MNLEQAKEWAHRAEPAEVFITSHPRKTQNALWVLVEEIDRLKAELAKYEADMDSLFFVEQIKKQTAERCAEIAENMPFPTESASYKPAELAVATAIRKEFGI